MLLFIMAFAVTGNAFAGSADVSAIKKTVNVYYTQNTVTLSSNYNCAFRITINVQRNQRPCIFKSTYYITANKPIELRVEELFPNETAIITDVTGDIVEQPASEKPANNVDTFPIRISLNLGSIVLAVAIVIHAKSSKSKKE